LSQFYYIFSSSSYASKKYDQMPSSGHKILDNRLIMIDIFYKKMNYKWKLLQLALLAGLVIFGLLHILGRRWDYKEYFDVSTEIDTEFKPEDKISLPWKAGKTPNCGCSKLVKNLTLVSKKGTCSEVLFLIFCLRSFCLHSSTVARALLCTVSRAHRLIGSWGF
jgi:hypothetical protein